MGSGVFGAKGITGSYKFTPEEKIATIDSVKRGVNPQIKSLSQAIPAICDEYVLIFMTLEYEDIAKIKELGGSDSLCESLAVIGKRALNGGK